MNLSRASLFAVLVLTACPGPGGGGGGKVPVTTSDATTSGDTTATTSGDTSVVEDSTSPTTAVSDSSVTTTAQDTSVTTTTQDTSVTTTSTQDTSVVNDTSASCDRTGFTFTEAHFTHSDASRINLYVTSQTDGDNLAIEFFPELGTENPNPLESGEEGTYPIASTSDDQNYRSCSTCVLIRTDCNSETGCDHQYYATAGQIVITSVDFDALTISGRVEDARFEEVTIDTSDFTSTPIPGGDTWCVDSVAFTSSAECTDDGDCDDVSKPFCDTATNTCAVCTNGFQCTAANPVCQRDADDVFFCGPAIATCVGDDAFEQNDGPTQAAAFGTSAAGKICGGGGLEEDWYTFSVSSTTDVQLELAWTDTSIDLDFALIDENGAFVETGATEDQNPEVISASIQPGTYFVLVVPFELDGNASFAYTLTKN